MQGVSSNFEVDNRNVILNNLNKGEKCQTKLGKKRKNVATYFNGKRTPLSENNGKVTRADVIHDNLFIECKLEQNIPLLLFGMIRQNYEEQDPCHCTM